MRYRPLRCDDADVRARLRALSGERRRFGYRRLHVMLHREGKQVARELDALIARRGRPLTVVSDNGTELTSMATLTRLQDQQVAWHYIAPGKPQQNAFVESSNGRLCDECLDETLFTSLACARGARRLAARLQRGATAFGAGRANPGLDHAAAVLARVTAAARRLRRWPSASLDPGCARRPRRGRPGQRNGARPNRETQSRSVRRNPGTLLLNGGKLGLRS
ncbi:MAG: transposase family protein [Acetobacteraceae bacterium]|nr:transposase family protein [Acetobacteraceae bacterium]